MKLLTPTQISEMLQIDRRTIYRWIRDGKLPGFKIGGSAVRVKESDLEAFINKSAATGKGKENRPG